MMKVKPRLFRARGRPGRTFLAIDRHGRRIYVELGASGIDPRIAALDRLRLGYFGGDRTPYVRVETALRWHEKALRRCPDCSGHKTMIDAFKRVLERFKAGEIEETEP